MSNMTNIINLTPHAISIITPTGSLVVSPSGETARVSQSETPRPTVECDGMAVPIAARETGEVVGLPEPRTGFIYIVSGMVAASARRADVFSPGPLVRDESGRPIGCRGLFASL